MKLLKTLSAATCITATMALMPSCNSSDEKKTDGTKMDSTTVKHDSTMTPAKPDNILVVVHKVKDFDIWLKAYDGEGKAKRMENGLIDRSLSRGIDDPNMVTVIFVVTDMAKAKARIGSEELKKLMMDAGVEGPPQISYFKIVDLY